jgi:hypothetical protein
MGLPKLPKIYPLLAKVDRVFDGEALRKRA